MAENNTGHVVEEGPVTLEITDELIAERRSGAPGELPEDMPHWMAFLISRIDWFSLWTGRIVCWLTVPIFVSMAYEIIVRYAFTAPTMWAYDISRMLYGALFMLGAGYGLYRGIHIRADFIYRHWSPRTQGIVDGTLYILFYFPGLIVFAWMATEFAYESWIIFERGMDTAWMPYVFPIKTALPVGIVMLLIQGVSELLKCLYAATKGRWPTS